MPGRLSVRAGRDRELGRRGPVLWVGVTSPGAGHLTLLRLCLSDLSGNLTASMLEKMCCKCQDRVFGTNPSRENVGVEDQDVKTGVGWTEDWQASP